MDSSSATELLEDRVLGRGHAGGWQPAALAAAAQFRALRGGGLGRLSLRFLFLGARVGG